MSALDQKSGTVSKSQFNSPTASLKFPSSVAVGMNERHQSVDQTTHEIVGSHFLRRTGSSLTPE